MDNIKMKNNKKHNRVGRPTYFIDICMLRQLYKKIDNKEISNIEGWKIAKCGKTKWYELKKKYYKLENNT